MATVRQYGYYIKGNKVAIVEKDTQFDNDINSKDYGPGSDRSQWKSPLASVADGLEIEYAYSPFYNVNSAGQFESDWFTFIGYGSDGTNLVLFTSGTATHLDLSSKFAADDYIYVSGGTFAGIHQVKETGSIAGYLTTKTLFSFPGTFNVADDTGSGSSSTATTLNFYGTGIIDLHNTGTPTVYGTSIHNVRSDLDYIFVADLAGSIGNEESGLISLNTGYTTEDYELDAVNQYTVAGTGAVTETAESFSTDTGNYGYKVFKAKQETATVYKVSVLNDESDEIDLSVYLSKALVYYVKAKLSEDAMNIEAKEYFMKEFRDMVEKHNNTRVAGLRIQSSGFHAIR